MPPRVGHTEMYIENVEWSSILYFGAHQSTMERKFHALFSA